MSNEPDNVNSGALATIIVLVALSTLAVALVVTALVRDETSRLHGEYGPTQRQEVEALWLAQESDLNQTPSWVDREKGIARIPIESAMEIVLENVRENPYALSPGSPPPEEEEEEETEEGAAPEEGEEPADSEQTGAEEPTDVPAPQVSPTPAPKAPASPPKPGAAPAPKAPAAPAPTPAPAPAPGGTPQ